MVMWVCKECFADEEIRKEVENNSIDEGKCDVCGRTGKRCDLSVFADFLVSVIQLFKKMEIVRTLLFLSSKRIGMSFLTLCVRKRYLMRLFIPMPSL